jgi:hypothetical protein
MERIFLYKTLDTCNARPTPYAKHVYPIRSAKLMLFQKW